MTRVFPKPALPRSGITIAVAEARVAACLDLARNLRDKGNLVQAIQACEEALELEPRHVEANQLFYDLVAEQQGLPGRGAPWQEIEVNDKDVPVEGAGRVLRQTAGGPVLLNPSGLKVETGGLPSLSRVANDRRALPAKKPELRQTGSDVRNVGLAFQEAKQAQIAPRPGARLRWLSARWIALLVAGVGLVLLVRQVPMPVENPWAAPGPVVRPSQPSVPLPNKRTQTDPDPFVQSKWDPPQPPKQAPALTGGVVENRQKPVALAEPTPAALPRHQAATPKPTPSKATGNGILEIYNLPSGGTVVLQGPGASTYQLWGSGSRNTWTREDLPLGSYRLRVTGAAGPVCTAKEMKVLIEDGIYTKVDFESRCRIAGNNKHGSR